MKMKVTVHLSESVKDKITCFMLIGKLLTQEEILRLEEEEIRYVDCCGIQIQIVKKKQSITFYVYE